MTTKPFNLQEALAGAPVTTRNGVPVVDLHIFPHLPKLLYGVRLDLDGEPNVIWRSLDGKLYLFIDSEADLVMAPLPTKEYFTISKDDPPRTYGPYSSEKKARWMGESIVSGYTILSKNTQGPCVL